MRVCMIYYKEWAQVIMEAEKLVKLEVQEELLLWFKGKGRKDGCPSRGTVRQEQVPPTPGRAGLWCYPSH